MRKMLLALVLGAVICLAAVSVAAADPGPIQVSGQSADTSQHAVAGSSATQTNPTNTNISIRVLSPGNDGNVTQSNAAGSSATAGNASNTAQGSSQTAGGGGAIQSSNQSASTSQLAAALSLASQTGATNTNMPIRVLSPGNDGNVSQTNAVGSSATAGNAAGTSQTGTQTAAGGSSCGCSGSGTPVQLSDQSASTDQDAGAVSHAAQVDPSNTAVSVRVLSPGNGGNVSQANTVGSTATAGNVAGTTQSSHQAAAAAPCGCSGTSIQQADQSAETDQEAAALSGAAQADPSNEASPVRVGSGGNDGTVRQENAAASNAAALNGAATTQQGSQSAGSGNAIQIASQDASTAQGALAASAAAQHGASNDASPVRVDSPGNGGSVTQSNAVGSSATAGNTAGTAQNAAQTAAGGTCRCEGTGIQVLGQKSDTDQTAIGLSEATQLFGERSPCGCGGSNSGNTASPVRVGSAGDDGTTSQANTVYSSAAGLNGASTRQNGTQSEAGGGLQIQALGQKSETDQGALAASLAAQAGASNEASPVRVYSPGGGGSVSQSNAAGSSATAGNGADTQQDGRQAIAGSPCGCGSLPIQVAGQSARTLQAAFGLSAALQAHPSNTSSPTRVSSGGVGGSSWQSNADASRGDALDRALTRQGVVQGS